MAVIDEQVFRDYTAMLRDVGVITQDQRDEIIAKLDTMAGKRAGDLYREQVEAEQSMRLGSEGEG